MQQYMNKIQNTVLFKGFRGSEVQQALGCLQGSIKDFGRKDFIFKQEEYLEAAGIILEGNVLLCKENSSGTRFIFSELADGEIIGETALRQEQEPSGYEAIAGSACRILFIRMNNIIRPGHTTCHLRGRIIENMLALLLENNRSMYQKLDLVSHKSLRERIIHYLSIQARKNNSPAFEIPFSRSDLADYLTVDRSALSRELQRMAQDGLIRFTRNQFELLTVDYELRW